MTIVLNCLLMIMYMGLGLLQYLQELVKKILEPFGVVDIYGTELYPTINKPLLCMDERLFPFILDSYLPDFPIILWKD